MTYLYPFANNTPQTRKFRVRNPTAPVFRIAPEVANAIRDDYLSHTNDEHSYLLIPSPDNDFDIIDIFTPRQYNTGAYTDIDPSSVSEYLVKYANRPNGLPYLWTHTHPNFEPNPSGIDEGQWAEFLEMGMERVAMLICMPSQMRWTARYAIRTGTETLPDNTQIPTYDVFDKLSVIVEPSLSPRFALRQATFDKYRPPNRVHYSETFAHSNTPAPVPTSASQWLDTLDDNHTDTYVVPDAPTPARQDKAIASSIPGPLTRWGPPGSPEFDAYTSTQFRTDITAADGGTVWVTLQGMADVLFHNIPSAAGAVNDPKEWNCIRRVFNQLSETDVRRFRITLWDTCMEYGRSIRASGQAIATIVTSALQWLSNTPNTPIPTTSLRKAITDTVPPTAPIPPTTPTGNTLPFGKGSSPAVGGIVPTKSPFGKARRKAKH